MFFLGIDCFKGTFNLQVKDKSQVYEVLLRRVAYTLQATLKRRAREATKAAINSATRHGWDI